MYKHIIQDDVKKCKLFPSRFIILIVLLLDRNKQQASDAQLLTRALVGDADAFGDLYERYLDAIYHYTFYRVNGHQEAEDLTASIFLRAWQALDTHPPRKAPFRLWLYRIAHNAVVDYPAYRPGLLTLQRFFVFLPAVQR